jgi:hypothetical protein
MIRTIGPHNPTAKIRILDLLTVGDLSRSPTLDRAVANREYEITFKTKQLVLLLGQLQLEQVVNYLSYSY